MSGLTGLAFSSHNPADASLSCVEFSESSRIPTLLADVGHVQRRGLAALRAPRVGVTVTAAGAAAARVRDERVMQVTRLTRRALTVQRLQLEFDQP